MKGRSKLRYAILVLVASSLEVSFLFQGVLKATKSSSRVWKAYVDHEYDFTLRYKGAIGTDEGNRFVNVMYVLIDPQSEPIHLCVAHNVARWTSRVFFEHWQSNPPFGGASFPCGSYPPYARITQSQLKIDGQDVLQVTINRGPYTEICTYFSSARTILVLRLPPHDSIKDAHWECDLAAYNKIVSTVTLLN